MELAQRETPSIGTLASNVVRDSEKLIRQEIQLVEAKVRREVAEKVKASATYATVVALTGAALVLFALALVFFLNHNASVPLWASFALTGAIPALVALGFFWRAKHGQREKTGT